MGVPLDDRVDIARLLDVTQSSDIFGSVKILRSVSHKWISQNSTKGGGGGDIWVSGELIRLRNRSKLVERNLFAILICCKERSISFCTLYGGMIFIKKIQTLEKKIHFVLLHLIFQCYYCSRNRERQSEHSGLCPVTSSLVCFNFNLFQST